MNEPSDFVQVQDVHKSYGRREVLRGIDLTVHRGEVVCLIGPSGSGKSTLLRCINHLEKVDTGRVIVDGEVIGYRLHNGRYHEQHENDIARQRREIGMVFQQFNLFPHMTVLRNLIEAPTLTGRLTRTDTVDRARALLERVGLGDRGDAYPQQLSGGQQQRVAIARALTMHPKLMLFDEPTSALDPELVGEVLDVMGDLAADGMTMIVVTHELEFAREVADTVYFLSDGVIVEHGPAKQVIDTPKHERTKTFMSRVRSV